MASYMPCSRPVRKSPGATALTRTPAAPTSRASRLVSPTTAAFDAAYGAPVTGDGWRPPMEDVVTMAPPPAPIINGTAAWQQ